VGTALDLGRLSIGANGRAARGADIGMRFAGRVALIGTATALTARAGGAAAATGPTGAWRTGPGEAPLAGAVPVVAVPPGLAAGGPALGLSSASGFVPGVVPAGGSEPPLGGLLAPPSFVVVPGAFVPPLVAGLSVVGLLAGLSVLPLVDVLPLLAPALLPLLELEPDVFVAVPLVLLLVVVFVELVSLVVLLVVLLELWLDVVVVVPASCVESAPAGSSAGGVAGASAVPVSGATVVASVVVVLSAAAVVSVVVPVAEAAAAVNPQHAIANAEATRRCRLVNRALRVAAVPALGTKGDLRPRGEEGLRRSAQASRRPVARQPVVATCEHTTQRCISTV
jgi:hypothetical protein